MPQRVLHMRSRYLVLVLIVVSGLFATSAALAQGTVSMSVTPSSGQGPLTVTVQGSPCLDVASPTIDDADHMILLEWQANGNPSTAGSTMFSAGVFGTNWSATILLGLANTGTNDITASCLDPGGIPVRSYPSQQVEVLPLPAELTVSDTTVVTGGSFSAAATQCPDLNVPVLGGSYSVAFTFESTTGGFSETIVDFSGTTGIGSATFVVPVDAPAGTNYQLTAVCQIQELGFTNTLFEYTPIDIEVVAPVPPELTVSETTVDAGATFTATATQCPDPDGPILGGSYSVAFTLVSLTDTFSEITVLNTDQLGVATAQIAVPFGSTCQPRHHQS